MRELRAEFSCDSYSVGKHEDELELGPSFNGLWFKQTCVHAHCTWLFGYYVTWVAMT